MTEHQVNRSIHLFSYEEQCGCLEELCFSRSHREHSAVQSLLIHCPFPSGCCWNGTVLTQDHLSPHGPAFTRPSSAMNLPVCPRFERNQIYLYLTQICLVSIFWHRKKKKVKLPEQRADGKSGPLCEFWSTSFCHLLANSFRLISSSHWDLTKGSTKKNKAKN